MKRHIREFDEIMSDTLKKKEFCDNLDKFIEQYEKLGWECDGDYDHSLDHIYLKIKKDKKVSTREKSIMIIFYNGRRIGKDIDQVEGTEATQIMIEDLLLNLADNELTKELSSLTAKIILERLKREKENQTTPKVVREYQERLRKILIKKSKFYSDMQSLFNKTVDENSTQEEKEKTRIYNDIANDFNEIIGSLYLY